MESMLLNGSWTLYYGVERPNRENPLTLEDAVLADFPSIPVLVPCEAQRALTDAGLWPDPFVDENIYAFRELEFYRFFFTRTFTYSPPDAPVQTILRFEGLDTFATIFLNDEIIGTAENMLIPHDFDVSGKLLAGENLLTVRLDSAMNALRGKEIPLALQGCEQFVEQVLLRKPAASFGWDIAPRLVTAGIWRDISLVHLPPTRLTQFYFQTLSADENHASLRLKYTLETDDIFLEDLTLSVTGTCGESEFSFDCKVNSFAGQAYFSVEDPALWWPLGYGTPHLYDVALQIRRGKAILFTGFCRLGIRTIALDAAFEEAEAGRFSFIVNGKPVFIKGTNWVQLDALHSRDMERTEQALALLTDCGCNMVRCWGGNVYESDLFFDICDEKGILVWQDFSMACGIYPRDENFRKAFADEAENVVKRLRNRASLALWCGDNENDATYFWTGQSLPHSRQNPLTRQVLPDILAEHDPYRPYLPSSPYLTPEMTKDTDGPEQHNWGPRDYFKGAYYRSINAHFISEIGYHGCPAKVSLAQFIPAAQLESRRGPAWTTHNTEYRLADAPRGYDRIQLMENQVACLFGDVPADLDEFVLASQFTQAEAKKFFIETARLLKPRRTGIIWWNLLDCWPQISDAVVDYYFEKKVAFDVIRRAQAPVCLICAEAEDRGHTVVLCNDGALSGWALYEIADAETGDVIACGSAFTEADKNLPLCVIPAAAAGETIFYRLTLDVGGEKFENHYVSFTAPQDFARYAEFYETTLQSL